MRATKTTAMAVTWANTTIRARSAVRTTAGPRTLLHTASGRMTANAVSAITNAKKGVPVKLITQA